MAERPFEERVSVIETDISNIQSNLVFFGGLITEM